MEELFVYAVLLYEEIILKDLYQEKLHALFLKHPESGVFLELEWEADIKQFANKMYSLWKNLPDKLQDEQPFFQLSYADDPLSWGTKSRQEVFMRKCSTIMRIKFNRLREIWSKIT